MKDHIVWAHFTSTGYYPTLIRLLRQIPKEKFHIDTICCCFKMMHIDWDNTVVTGMSGFKIEMPTEAKVSIFTDNDLTHINDDHFDINLVACLLNQIYVMHPQDCLLSCQLCPTFPPAWKERGTVRL